MPRLTTWLIEWIIFCCAQISAGSSRLPFGAAAKLMCITFFDHEHTQSMPLKSLPRRNHHHHSCDFLNAHCTYVACTQSVKNETKKFKFTIFMAVAYDDDGCWPLLTGFLAPSHIFSFILFSISMGLAFCIDETINELIMTNDRGS